MTRGEYSRRQDDSKVPGACTITVLQHKMAHKGPVNISVAPEFTDYFEIFVKDVRNRLEGIGNDKEDLIFTTYQGSAMSTSLLGMSKFLILCLIALCIS